MTKTMKDSGIEWIGEIPEDWSITRIKSCIAKRDSGAWGEEANNSEGDCICLRIADFDYNKFRFSDSDDLTIRHYPLNVIEKLKLEKNDILIEKSGGGEKTPVGRTVLFDKIYTALYANFMDRLRCSNIVKPSYMQYVFVAFYKNEYTRNYIKQTTGIQNLDLTAMLSKELMPLPSMPEQQKIADFLDEKCSHIDSILEKTKASINECKQLKQSVITQAVTKGIKPNRPMKDSEIEWIGEIPEDWDISKVKREFSYGSGLPITKENLIENGVQVISYGQIHAKFNTGVKLDEKLYRYVSEDYLETNSNSLVNKYDFIFADTSEDLEGCGNCAYISEQMTLFAGYHTIILHSKKAQDNRYIAYLFKSQMWRNQITSRVTGIKVFSISKKILNACTLLIPSFAEQIEIANYLDLKCSEIDKLITKKEQLIKELETYKKSLIYEYVTGKKEVI